MGSNAVKKNPRGAQSSELKRTHHPFSSFSSLPNTPLHAPPHRRRALKILKPRATYSSFLTTLSSQACLWGGSWKWKYLHDGRGAQLLTVYQEKEKKKMKETKKEKNKLWASNHGGLWSLCISRFDEEEEEKEGCFLMFFLFNFFFLSPSPSWLGPPSAAESRRGVAGV